jgi:hypothetical protein
MQSSESTNFQQIVLQRLEEIGSDVKRIDADLGELKQEQALTNTRVDTYQKASNQVVNLAFGLIATATITIIASVVLK